MADGDRPGRRARPATSSPQGPPRPRRAASPATSRRCSRTVEADGYDVNGIVANANSGHAAQARATTGQQLDPGAGSAATDSIYGVDITYPLRGLWPTGAGAAEMVAGDFTEGILAVRQDITWKLLDQAVIQDNTGAIIYNLSQQDMVAMRVVARFACTIAKSRPAREHRRGVLSVRRYEGA